MDSTMGAISVKLGKGMAWSAFKKDYFVCHKEDFCRGASIHIQKLKAFTSFEVLFLGLCSEM